MPNILALDDTLTDMSTIKIIDQAKQFNPLIRIALFITRINEFKMYRNSPIVIAEQDMLLDPNTLALFAMALITNTSYRSISIEKRLKQLDQAAPDSFYGTIKLTPREHQLLEAYALGMSNQETAEKLGLSVRSIQTYSGNLLQKLGTSNRQKAVRRAISMGLSDLAQLFT
jgi:DNA-binding NarL/FixJ family response regulator